MLSRLVVEGEIKPIFFWNKKRNFEIHIFFTPVKKTILKIEFENDTNSKDLDLSFRVGDNISSVYEWIEKEGHKIIFKINR